jgi:hypothetical protein
MTSYDTYTFVLPTQDMAKARKARDYFGSMSAMLLQDFLKSEDRVTLAKLDGCQVGSRFLTVAWPCCSACLKIGPIALVIAFVQPLAYGRDPRVTLYSDVR